MDSPIRTDAVMTCAACGASVYQEHIDRGLAGMWGGQILCPACQRERKEKESDKTGAGPDQLDSLPLVSDDSGATGRPEESSGGGLPGLSAAEAVGQEGQAHPRSPSTPGAGARRLRTFHARLSEGAVRHLDEQVNAWLESHPEIEIKFANTTVGVWEAKHAEPNLIVMIFY